MATTKQTQLYLLRLKKGSTASRQWDRTSRAFVIRAQSEENARAHAALTAGKHYDERDAWLDSEQTSCEKIQTDAPEAVVLEDWLRL